MGSSAAHMVVRKARRSRDMRRCRVEAHDQSLHTGLRRFTKKPSYYLVEPQNQDRRLGRWRRDLGAPRSFDVGGHAAESQGLLREDADAAKAWTLDEDAQVLTILPLRGVYLPLCSRVAWSFAQPRETSYI
jgi:hypothetical protein